MGDFGQELGLGAGGLGEYPLDALALADVAGGRLEAGDLAALAEDWLREGLEPGVLSRLLANAIDDRDGSLSFERLFVGCRTDALQVLGVKEIVGVGAEQLFGLVAEQPPARGADVDVTSVRLVQADEVARLLGEQAKTGLALTQSLLCLFSPCDGPEGDDRADDPATLPDRGAHVLYWEVCAVFAPEDLVA